MSKQAKPIMEKLGKIVEEEGPHLAREVSREGFKEVFKAVQKGAVQKGYEKDKKLRKISQQFHIVSIVYTCWFAKILPLCQFRFFQFAWLSHCVNGETHFL